VLDELKVLNKPTIIALNKIDKLEARQRLDEFKRNIENVMGISALKGENIQQLLLLIEDILSQDSVDVDIVLPADRMDLVNLAHSQGQVQEVQFLGDGIHLKASLPVKIAGALTTKCKRPNGPGSGPKHVDKSG